MFDLVKFQLPVKFVSRYHVHYSYDKGRTWHWSSEHTFLNYARRQMDITGSRLVNAGAREVDVRVVDFVKCLEVDSNVFWQDIEEVVVVRSWK